MMGKKEEEKYKTVASFAEQYIEYASVILDIDLQAFLNCLERPEAATKFRRTPPTTLWCIILYVQSPRSSTLRIDSSLLFSTIQLASADSNLLHNHHRSKPEEQKHNTSSAFFVILSELLSGVCVCVSLSFQLLHLERVKKTKIKGFSPSYFWVLC